VTTVASTLLWTAPDPGAGERLGPAARSELAAAIKTFARGEHGAVLIEVEGDAWARSPDGEAADHRAITGAHRLVAALHAVPRPVVVSVSGTVAGLGTALLLCADVRVLGPAASVRVGDGPAAALLGAGRWLADRAGVGATYDRLAWTGGSLDAAEAVSSGFATVLGDGSVAAAHAERLAGDPGWAMVRRAARSRLAAELDEVLGYQAWLVDALSGTT
jgi:enoyl-CoA hydratase/carnithine racemase